MGKHQRSSTATRDTLCRGTPDRRRSSALSMRGDSNDNRDNRSAMVPEGCATLFCLHFPQRPSRSGTSESSSLPGESCG